MDEAAGISVSVLVTKESLEHAWRWLISSMSARPTQPTGECVYDLKSWHDDVCSGPLVECGPVVRKLADLYLTSQLGDRRAVLDLINGRALQDVEYMYPSLDKDVKTVINDPRRFRNHLSEHLSFWVRVATDVIRMHEPPTAGVTIGHSKPNMQPEDKGPDGLFLRIEDVAWTVEVLSVKSSINNPTSLVASAGYRKRGLVDEASGGKTLLEEFHLITRGELGRGRLEDKLEILLNELRLDADQRRRAGLLAEAAYDGVVVADACYASPSVFRASATCPYSPPSA